MFVTAVISVILVATCCYLHVTAMRILGRFILREQSRLRHPFMIVLMTLFFTHMLEVMVYAMGAALLDLLGKGSLSGAIGGDERDFLFDHFYFSISSYTTLGIGDIVPHGSLRLLAGVEALNGLVLIAWSASLTYLMMERLWGEAGPRENEEG